MKTLKEKIVESILANVSSEISQSQLIICEEALKDAIKDIIRSKQKFDSDLITILTPKFLSKIEDLLRHDS